MKRVLIVKITSLGDVVLAQPVVDDLRRAFPGIIIDWATDGAFAEIPSWNPGVSAIHSAPLRKFKRLRNRQGANEIIQSVRALREHRYDAIFDIHGAYKSAIVSFLARAKRRYGYQSSDLGEKGAGFAYSHRMRRPPHATAVEGMRLSVANAMGYQLVGAPSFGLTVPRTGTAPTLGPDTAIFLHGASKAEKNWPIEHWLALGNALIAKGLKIALPWGSDEEHARAEAIAAALPGASVLPRLSLGECAQVLDEAALVVGVDTGLTHLAHAFGRPSVMIFITTSNEHFGISAPGQAISIGGDGHCPSVEEALLAIASVYPAPTPAQ